MVSIRTYSIVLLFTCISLTLGALENHLKFHQYCTYYGYPVEEHIISTQDNYNLKYFRIQKKNTQIVQGKKVVYLQHGVLDSSDTWIVNSQNLGAAFVLANRGYDVWVGNTRGNHYSTKKLSPIVRDYWGFTFNQMAYFDLPAAFQYIVSKTSRKIHYIGHSQGTTIMFIALSENIPAIKNNILSFNAWGPVTYLTNCESKLLKNFAKRHIMDTVQRLGDRAAFIFNDRQLSLLSTTCKVDPLPCKEGLLMISQKNNTVNNLQRLPTIMGHYPAGTSIKSIIHFEQFANSPYFRKYDYGERQNLKKYGTPKPPAYNLSNIDIPVNLFVGSYDKLATVKDNERLWSQLVNSPNKTIHHLNYGHATFVWGKSIEHIEKTIEIIEAFPQSI